MTDVLAVFDVGKTNKKVVLFNDALQIVDRWYRSFPTQTVDGVEVEPIEAIGEWFLQTLAEAAQRYLITAIAVSTHGAAVVTLDERGEVACPVVSYTHEPDAGLHDRFYAAMGGRDALQRTTATAEVRPLINPAKLLFFTRERWPERFQRVRDILFFPQYFSYLLTGRPSVDYTYVGCHTYLWDFARWDWSEVAERLGIRSALPPRPVSSWEVAGAVSPEVARRTGLGADTPVTVGIHDSNASLLPYLLAKRDERFVLNSTGTWCVAMNPREREARFSDDEIGKTVFFNISPYGKAVKTAILMGGQEFETYTAVLKRIHDTEELPEFNPTLYRRVIARAQQFIIPGVVPGSGQFPHSRARVIDGDQEYALEEIQSGRVVPPLFQDLPAAYAVLNLSLALQTKVALGRVGVTAGMAIFTEGGFRKNPDYNALTAALFPDNRVYLTNIEEATSLGAALTARAARDGRDPAAYADAIAIESFAVNTERLPGLERYEAAFLEHI